jgi:hypothetical protein
VRQEAWTVFSSSSSSRSGLGTLSACAYSIRIVGLDGYWRLSSGLIRFNPRTTLSRTVPMALQSPYPSSSSFALPTPPPPPLPLALNNHSTPAFAPGQGYVNQYAGGNGSGTENGSATAPSAPAGNMQTGMQSGEWSSVLTFRPHPPRPSSLLSSPSPHPSSIHPSSIPVPSPYHKTGSRCVQHGPAPPC